jgi:hypothetical protein
MSKNNYENGREIEPDYSYLLSVITTKDIDELRSEKLRQERIFQKHIVPTLSIGLSPRRIYC